MADEPKVGVTPEPQAPEQPKASETPAAIDPAEFAKVQAALKEANREAAERRKKLDAYEKAEAERKQAEMTEVERANAKMKEYETKLATLERDALVRRVADETGLPAALASRLQGATEEELKADAAKLLELVPAAPNKPKLKTDPSNPGNAQKAETLAEMRARLIPGRVNIWDPAYNKSRGGGLVQKEE